MQGWRAQTAILRPIRRCQHTIMRLKVGRILQTWGPLSPSLIHAVYLTLLRRGMTIHIGDSFRGDEDQGPYIHDWRQGHWPSRRQ
jgi:hypothetical protein